MIDQVASITLKDDEFTASVKSSKEQLSLVDYDYGKYIQVVAGISSAFSAPLLANIPLTHRGVSNQVYICTGYGKEGEQPYLQPYVEEAAQQSAEARRGGGV